MLCGMANLEPKPSRRIITVHTMDEAKAAAYTNDPQTELVILGISENPAVTTCGWARQFFRKQAVRILTLPLLGGERGNRIHGNGR